MGLCMHCALPVDGDALTEGGLLLHPACLTGRVASEALVGLAGLAATFLAPAVIVWAG